MDMKATWADISKARDIFDWQPQVRLEEGIKRTVEWTMRLCGLVPRRRFEVSIDQSANRPICRSKYKIQDNSIHRLKIIYQSTNLPIYQSKTKQYIVNSR
jgi:hypothetical protein